MIMKSEPTREGERARQNAIDTSTPLRSLIKFLRLNDETLRVLTFVILKAGVRVADSTHERVKNRIEAMRVKSETFSLNSGSSVVSH